MRVTTEAGSLAEALGWAKGVINPRATLPVLSGALLTAAEGRLVIEASDTLTTVRRWLPAEVGEPGKVVAPHRLLEVATRLPGGKVALSTVDDRLVVEAGTMSASVTTLDARDWPDLPSADIDAGVVVPAETWALAAKRVASTVPRQAPAPWAAGVILRADGEGLSFTAVADPRVIRLVARPDGPVPEFTVSVAPEVLTLAADLGTDVAVSVADGVVGLVDAGDTSIMSTLLAKQAPDVSSSLLAPTEGEPWASPDDVELLEALGRATTLLGIQPNVPVTVTADEDGAVALSYTGDLGSLDEVVDASVSEGWRTWVNPAYLAWAIKSLDGGLARMALTPRKAVRCDSLGGAITTLFMSMRGDDE